ncbi:MAG: SGNH/GDSL hydrolase family protein [Candidatus Neomarinimicrobiota bacterium]
MKKKSTYLITYNIIAILLLFILSEGAVRIFKSEIQIQGTTQNLIADRVYFQSRGLRPFGNGMSNGVRVNVDQYGFRKYSRSIDRSKKSWLFIGDSVTMGIGVEADSTYPGIIQDHVDSINILNPSVIGHDIEDYENVFEYFVLENENEFNISRVTIFWSLNDIYSSIEDIDTPGGKVRYIFSDFLRYLRYHSKLYYFLKTVIFDRPKDYYLYDQSFYKADNILFKDAIKQINMISKNCRMRDIRFGIVLLPYEYQMRKESEPYRFPQRLMMRSLRESNINVYSILDETYNKDSKELYLYGDGIHFSKVGHKYIARYLVEKMLQDEGKLTMRL